MKNFIILFILALLLAPFALAECSFSTKDAKEFHLLFNIRPDLLSDVEMRLVVPLDSECSQEFSERSGNFECSEAFLSANDALFKSLGFFANDSTCFGEYSDGELRINYRTQTDLIVNQLPNNSVEVTFRDWNVSNSTDELSLKNSLTIKLPLGSKLIAFYPMADPSGVVDYEKGVIVWEPIPSKDKKPSVKFSIADNSLFYGIITAILVIIVGGLAFFIIKKKKERDIIQQIKSLKLKMAILEQDFMKGKMDETTYRRLMEQYQLQLNDLKAQMAKKSEPKEKSG